MEFWDNDNLNAMGLVLDTIQQKELGVPRINLEMPRQLLKYSHLQINGVDIQLVKVCLFLYRLCNISF